MKETSTAAEDQEEYQVKEEPKLSKMTKKKQKKVIAQMESDMKEAAKALDFERAAELRDLLLELKSEG